MGVWVVPLAPAVRIIIGGVVHPNDATVRAGARSM